LWATIFARARPSMPCRSPKKFWRCVSPRWR
jgi:hypothetical protein